MTSKKHRKKMNEMLVSLYLTEEMKARLSDLSEEYGIPRSQLVSYALLALTNRVNQALDILPRYLVPSKAARWRYNIDLDRFRDDFEL